MSRKGRYVLVGVSILAALPVLFVMFGLSPYADAGPAGKLAIVAEYLEHARKLVDSKCKKRTLKAGMTSADLGINELYDSASRRHPFWGSIGKYLVQHVFVRVETLNRIIVGAELRELRDGRITFWPRTVAPAGKQLVFLYSCGERGLVGLEYWSDLPEQYTRFFQSDYRRSNMPLQPTR